MNKKEKEAVCVLGLLSLFVILCSISLFAVIAIQSYQARNVPEKCQVEIYPFSQSGPIVKINDLLDKGWRVCYTSMDSCGNLQIELEKKK